MNKDILGYAAAGVTAVTLLTSPNSEAQASNTDPTLNSTNNADKTIQIAPGTFDSGAYGLNRNPDGSISIDVGKTQNSEQSELQAPNVPYPVYATYVNFDRVENRITFILDESDTLFSEPGVEAEIGRVKVLTTEGVKKHKVELFLDYNLNITFSGNDDIVVFQASSVPYKFRFQNGGFSGAGNQILLFERV